MIFNDTTPKYLIGHTTSYHLMWYYLTNLMWEYLIISGDLMEYATENDDGV